MPKADLFFYCAVLFLLNLFPLMEQGTQETRNLLSMIAIVALGIPHGAIDNVLFLRHSRVSVLKFFVIYIAAIGANAALWFILPELAYAGFILLSAYHFGQSQWNDVNVQSLLFKNLLYGSWGMSVILTYLYFNLEELNRSLMEQSDLEPFIMFFTPQLILPSLLLSLLCTAVLLLWHLYEGALGIERGMRELFVYALVVATAYLFDFLIGFATFFVLVHAYKVLQTEFGFFHRHNNVKARLSFFWQLLPLTLLSILGVGMLVALVYFDVVQISYPLLFMVVVSSITLPHAFVMDRFYKHQINRP